MSDLGTNSFNKVIFFNDHNGTDMVAQTEDATLTPGHIYEPDIKGDTTLYVLNPNRNDNIWANFNNTGIVQGQEANNSDAYRPADNGNRKWYVDNGIGGCHIATTNTTFKVRLVDDQHTWSAETTLKNHGIGEVWKVSGGTSNTDSNDKPTLTFQGYVGSDGKVTTNPKVPVTSRLNPNGGSNAKVSYQPEDRYGYIADEAGTSDENNFIKIVTNLKKPYIHFYSDDNGTAEIGTFEPTTTTTGISLEYTAMLDSEGEAIDNSGQTGDGSTSDPYMIRLPKNARSFKITGTNSTTSATVTSTAQPLYDNGFHYAGATFTVANDGTITVTPRTYTQNRAETMTDPLYPRSDGDYIFFTDTGNTFANDGKVYAYFYGDMDGEFEFKYDESSASITWPGVVAEQGSNQPTTYTDNNGNTVYMFRVPQSRNGKYSYVMFNDGGTDNTRKITEAQPLEAGKNYVLDTTAENQKVYGTVTNSAYALNVEDKALAASASYGSANKYIYIMNNGTYNMGLVSGEDRTVFDEMHVVFYDMYNHVIGAESGYIPDRLGTGDTWEVSTKDDSEVYRIVVPSNAKYFQITNGVNKGLADGEDTHAKERYSEIEEIADNGLYRFLASGDSGVSANADYIEGTSVPSAEANLHTPKYLLKLVNPLEIKIPETIIRDVKLATVVTDTNGKPMYIKWLKPKPVEGKEYNLSDPSTYQANTVDTEYLKHTKDDIYNPETQTPLKDKVSVMKKGTYYWVETAAPSGYDVNTDKHLMFVEDDGSIYFYDENNNRVKVEGENKLMIVNEPSNTQSEVILTKTAKEKVGTIDIGDALAGAQFKLVKVNADGTTDDTLRFTLVTADNTNKYTLGSGTHNQSGSWLTTGTDGKMHIFNLVNGDYYLEEQKAPKGYSHLDSNVLGSDLKPTKKKIYFSVGENREVKEISATDEMEPSYIRLFEHINMKKDEWGNPTFVFKIKQTGYYAWSTAATPAWEYTTTDSGKEILVALTVDDNKNITNVVKWFNPTGINFDEDKIDNTTYGDWLVEGTTDLEDYQGIFDIDSKGRIKVEPGSYEITRVPVSRYEFVTNGKTAAYDNDTLPPDWTEYTVNGNKSEKLKIGEDNNGTMVGLLEPGKTIDVHYYDKVGYYDKFSQVDEEINKFYTLDENTKANKTIKGIRVEDYKVDAPTSGNDKDSINNGNLITQALTTSPRFKAYYIYADGSEAKITDTNELGKFVISYKYDSTSGDKASFATDFSYDADQRTIKINNYSNYKNGVYTLKATYDNKFTTNFDIVFERS